MALLLAFTFPVKAKAAVPYGNEIGLYNEDGQPDFEIICDNVEFLGNDGFGFRKLYKIEQMVVGQEITITISPIPINTRLGSIQCFSLQNDVVAVQETPDNPNVFTLKALREYNTNFITITLYVQLVDNSSHQASIRINKIVPQGSANPTPPENYNNVEFYSCGYQLKKKQDKLFTSTSLTMGGSGWDFYVQANGIRVKNVTFEDSDYVKIAPKETGSDVYHITALKETPNKITINVLIDGKKIDKTITITKVNGSSTGGGIGSNGDNTEKLKQEITELETKNDQLKIKNEELSKANDSLNEQLKSKEEENIKLTKTIDEQKKYEYEKIDLVYTALIAFGATLLLSILVFVIIHNKKKRSLVSDLYNANYQITTLEERLKNVQTNNIDTNNSKVKVYENEIIKLKKELEDARMDLYKLQQQQQTTPPSPAPAPTPAPEPVPTPTPIPVEPEPPLSVFLYADNIIDGCLNKVVNMPDIENTIYELVLDNENASTARVRVYDGARPRILRYPTFLEGCEMQILNSNGTIVDVVKEGVATKDNNGNWVVTTPPMIEIR